MRKRSKTPTLRFNPTAWAKLLFLRDAGETEVGGFGVSADDDPLLVEDFCLVKQQCSAAHVSFDDASVADFFDEQVDAGHRPEQFGRIWIHTHPGDCPLPSGVDEETFERVFGKSDWAVMFILARGGETYARLRFNQGPTADLVIPVDVDLSVPFDGSDWEAWESEYLANVNEWKQLYADAATDWNSEEQLFAEPMGWREAWFNYFEDEEEFAHATRHH